MSTFKSVNEIKAWIKARLLIKQIYRISDQGTFARDFGLRDQIRSSSVSIASNIAEGFERDGNAEFIHFLSIAKGSSGEVYSQLQNALDVGHLDKNVCSQLSEETLFIGKMIGNLMIYLRNAPIKGKKFLPSTTNPKRETRNPKRR